MKGSWVSLPKDLPSVNMLLPGCPEALQPPDMQDETSLLTCLQKLALLSKDLREGHRAHCRGRAHRWCLHGLGRLPCVCHVQSQTWMFSSVPTADPDGELGAGGSVGQVTLAWGRSKEITVPSRGPSPVSQTLWQPVLNGLKWASWCSCKSNSVLPCSRFRDLPKGTSFLSCTFGEGTWTFEEDPFFTSKPWLLQDSIWTLAFKRWWCCALVQLCRLQELLTKQFPVVSDLQGSLIKPRRNLLARNPSVPPSSYHYLNPPT